MVKTLRLHGSNDWFAWFKRCVCMVQTLGLHGSNSGRYYNSTFLARFPFSSSHPPILAWNADVQRAERIGGWRIHPPIILPYPTMHPPWWWRRQKPQKHHSWWLWPSALRPVLPSLCLRASSCTGRKPSTVLFQNTAFMVAKTSPFGLKNRNLKH